MTVSIEDIKKLREATQVSMADCKAALEEAGGDFEKAVEILRKKGALKARAKEARAVGAGLVEAYIHPGGRVGVLLELRCETDFVARNEAFKTLAHDIAMQIAAMNPLWVRPEDIPADILAKERHIWEESMNLGGKPEPIRAKIIEGKLQSYYKEVCLLEQPFVKNEDLTISELITEAIAKLGENIQVARFARFEIS
jgi:elongation factor Ts